MIKNILFDWDGTLAQTLDVWFDAYIEVLNRRKIKLENERDIPEKAFGKWAEGLKAIGIKDSDVAIVELVEIANNNLLNVKLYNNTSEILKKLVEKDINLALLTSSNNALLYPPLQKNFLDSYFKTIITRDDVKLGKPNPEIVNLALKRIDSKLDETIIVGDTESDIQTAKNSGIKSVLFLPTHNLKFYNKEYLLSFNPDYVISDLMELINIVK